MPSLPLDVFCFFDDLHHLQHHASVLSKRRDVDEVLICVDEITHALGSFPDVLPIESDGLIFVWVVSGPDLNLLLGDLIVNLIDFARL